MTFTHVYITKIGSKLVLTTNRNSHIGFRLVPKSVTLNDLEQHNGRSLRYFTEFASFGAYYVKVVEDIRHIL